MALVSVMTGTELQTRLVAAERSARWLAEKLGRSHTQVGRWVSGEQTIPAERVNEIRALLVPVPAAAELQLGAIVKAQDGVLADQPTLRFKVRRARLRPLDGHPACSECGALVNEGDIIASDIHGNGKRLCLQHVVPVAVNDEEADDGT